jgi:glycerol-3-phosphate dehydrogenase
MPLVTVTGGKWTTYRWMAEQVVDRAATEAGLPAVPCSTHDLRLNCEALPEGLEAMARFAIRHEAARTVEDILARRSRALFLDAAGAEASIGSVGEILAQELAPAPERLAGLLRAALESARRFRLS